MLKYAQVYKSLDIMFASGLCRRYCFRPTVEPVLLLFMFANFMSTPVLQQLLYNRICDETAECNDDDQNTTHSCSEPSEVEQRVETTTSHWILYINLANSIPSIFAACVAGGASDKVGRKVLIAIASAGGIINVIIIIMTSAAELPKYAFLFGAGLSGLFGGFTVMNLAVFSYVADVSGPDERTSRFGILESMTYIGGSLSGVIGGLWIKNGHFIQPFYFVGSLYTIVFIIIITPHLIPESVNTRDKMITFNVSKLMYQNIKSFIGLLVFNEHAVILVLLLVIFLVVEINFIGLSDVIVLFSLGRPLCWSSDLIGYFLSLKVALNGLAALFVLPFLSKKVTDPVIIIVGLFSGAAALIIMGFAYHIWIMFAAPLCGALRGCVVPSLRAMMSKYSPPDKEGVVFSGIASVETICSLLATLLYNALYPVMRTVYPGMCFHVMAISLIIPLILAIRLRVVTNRLHTRHHINDKNSTLLQANDLDDPQN